MLDIWLKAICLLLNPVGGNLSESIAGALSQVQAHRLVLRGKSPEAGGRGCVAATQPLPGDDRRAVGVGGAGNYNWQSHLARHAFYGLSGSHCYG